MGKNLYGLCLDNEEDEISRSRMEEGTRQIPYILIRKDSNLETGENGEGIEGKNLPWPNPSLKCLIFHLPLVLCRHFSYPACSKKCNPHSNSCIHVKLC